MSQKKVSEMGRFLGQGERRNLKIRHHMGIEVCLIYDDAKKNL